MKRIGVYGGTFDPPHFGHLAVAQAALKAGFADEVWLMVSPQNPLKQDKEISSGQLRLRMAQAAVIEIGCADKVKVSDFEFSLPRPSYTYNTLCHLRESYPDCSFTLIVGADNIESFPRWRNPEDIAREFGIIVYPRPGYSLPENIKNIKVLNNVELFDVSSTYIRDAAAKGEDILESIPVAVAEIIKDNSLYGQ